MIQSWEIGTKTFMDAQNNKLTTAFRVPQDDFTTFCRVDLFFLL